MHNVFYFTDVHGCWDLFYAMRAWCYKQDPECTIIFGGDACDRGDCGYTIMKAILEDPQMIYLRGNHEDFFVKSARAIYNNWDPITHKLTRQEALNIIDYMTVNDDDIYLHIANGGKETLVLWLMDGAPMYFVDQIAKLPVTFSYENIDFCHAGGLYSLFKKAATAEYNGDEPDAYNVEKLIWDRNAIEIGWEKDRICVYGHTPSFTLPSALYGKYKSESEAHPCCYTGTFAEDKWPGKKIAMDTGMVWTGRGYVLNVLTLEATGFYDAMPASRKMDKAPVTQLLEKYKII